MAGEDARGPYAPVPPDAAPAALRGGRRAPARRRTWPIPATARPRSSTRTARRRRRPSCRRATSAAAPTLTADERAAPRGRGPPRRAPLPGRRGRRRASTTSSAAASRSTPRTSAATSSSSARDGTPLYHFTVVVDDAAMADQPRHPRRGPPLATRPSTSCCSGRSATRVPAVRPPAAHPQPGPHEDEQAQEPDRGRATTSPRASSARRSSTTSRSSAGRPGPRRRSSRSTSSSSGSTSTRSTRAAPSSTASGSSGSTASGSAASTPTTWSTACGRSSRRSWRPAGSTGCPADDEIRALLPLVRERLPTLGAIGDLVGFLWVDDLDGRPGAARARSAGTRRRRATASPRPARRIAAHGAVTFEADELEPPLRALAEARGWKAGDLFMAIRVAVDRPDGHAAAVRHARRARPRADARPPRRGDRARSAARDLSGDARRRRT